MAPTTMYGGESALAHKYLCWCSRVGRAGFAPGQAKSPRPP